MLLIFKWRKIKFKYQVIWIITFFLFESFIHEGELNIICGYVKVVNISVSEENVFSI